MRTRRLTIVCAIVMVVSMRVVSHVSVAGAQSRSVYAISNARIYPVSGPMIEDGTVVIRDGLIEAVGDNVVIPVEATVIEGDGLTVFPRADR